MKLRILSSMDRHCADTAWAAGVALVRALQWLGRVTKRKAG